MTGIVLLVDRYPVIVMYFVKNISEQVKCLKLRIVNYTDLHEMRE
jgi:hypothetical protein